MATNKPKLAKLGLLRYLRHFSLYLFLFISHSFSLCFPSPSLFLTLFTCVCVWRVDVSLTQYILQNISKAYIARENQNYRLRSSVNDGMYCYSCFMFLGIITAVTLLLHCCYNVVTFVTLLLQCCHICYTTVTMLSHLLQYCYNILTFVT